MSWSLDATRRIWQCSSYSDLNYASLMNLAQYGQPMSPYEGGHDFNFVPDFKKVIIEMPQQEVMSNGFGRKITPHSFPVVRKFLNTLLQIPYDTYSFTDLVLHKVASPKDRIIKTDLYSDTTYGIDSGSLAPADAAHIYGQVGFALRQETRFIYASQFRRVEAEIGALDDNWDYKSTSTVAQLLNPFVAAFFGPDHYNLEEPIKILYRGPAKRAIAEKITPGSANSDRTKSPRLNLP